jgi:hypothetical protein
MSGQGVAHADRDGITKYGQAADATAHWMGKERNGGKRFHGHPAMITLRGSPLVSNG